MMKLNRMLQVAIFAIIGLTACTDTDEATRVLEAAGYTNIELLGYAPIACGITHGNMTGWHTKFKAIGLNGKPVSGAVCSGVFKSATINLD